jgi:hypothetical protein
MSLDASSTQDNRPLDCVKAFIGRLTSNMRNFPPHIRLSPAFTQCPSAFIRRALFVRDFIALEVHKSQRLSPSFRISQDYAIFLWNKYGDLYR